MRKLILVAFLSLSLKGYAQTTERSLKKNLEIFRDWYEMDPYPDLDSLANVTTGLIVKILQKKSITESDGYPNLTVLQSDDHKLFLYCFYYDTHGSSREQGYYMLQWKNDDGSFGAYALSSYLEKKKLDYAGGFWEIRKLATGDRTLYTLTGSAYNGVFGTNYVIQLVQIKGKYLVLDYPAFFKSSSTLIVSDRFDSPGSEGNQQENQTSESDDCYDYLQFDYNNRFKITIDCIGNDDNVGNFSGAYIKKKFGKRNLSFTWNGTRFLMK